MAFLERDEYFDRIREVIGDRTDDAALQFLDDVTETYDTLTERAEGGEAEEWKRKYEENDKMWSERYKERFFNGRPAKYKRTETAEIDENGDYKENITIDELFE